MASQKVSDGSHPTEISSALFTSTYKSGGALLMAAGVFGPSLAHLQWMSISHEPIRSLGFPLPHISLEFSAAQARALAPLASAREQFSPQISPSYCVPRQSAPLWTNLLLPLWSLRTFLSSPHLHPLSLGQSRLGTEVRLGTAFIPGLLLHIVRCSP